MTGGAFSGIIAKILKYLFNEQRPTDVSSDPGMPSSHSMNLFYLASYLCMYVARFATTHGLKQALRLIGHTLTSFVLQAGIEYLRRWHSNCDV
jgi:membrane-associated phospholipid phosphatase